MGVGFHQTKEEIVFISIFDSENLLFSFNLGTRIKKHRQMDDTEDEGFSDDNRKTFVKDDLPPDKQQEPGQCIDVKDLEYQREISTTHGSVSYSTIDVKPEPFDSGYGVHDAMLNGYTDLFHEVDSLMNIKHEDHLNDTVIYLPMSCPGEINPHVELENAIQMSEAFRNEFPGSVFGNSDIKSDSGIMDSILPFNESDFLDDHSKDSGNSSNNNANDLCSQKQNLNLLKKSKKPADCGLEGTQCVISNVDFEKFLPAGRKNRIKSGKSDSQSDDSGIGEPHSVSSSIDNTSLSCAESEGTVSPVGVCSINSSATNSPEAESQHDGEENKESREDSDQEMEKKERNLEVYDCVKEIKEEAGEFSGRGKSGNDIDAIEVCCSTSSGSSQEPSDIDRFVICSDHTMECVLCSYTTDSYSAFKSHIICSHPCWRITKKLSKNRLLVERSIKNGIRIPSKKIGEKALPGDLDSTLTGGRKLNKKYIYRRQLFERNKRLFKCVLCLRLFVFEGSVVNHVTETHQEKVAYDFIHVSNDHGEHFGPIYRCSQKSCFFSADNEADLNKHHTERHMQIIYRCQLCGFTAETADSVRAHGLRMHKQQLACFITSGPLAISQGAVSKSE